MRPIFEPREIEVTLFDARQLAALILSAGYTENGPSPWLERLGRLLKQARLVWPGRISPDTITMNSTVAMQDKQSTEKMNLTLVFPAAMNKNQPPNSDEVKVSILTPLGLSVLGRRVGECIGGRLFIEKMLYQPEASHPFHI